MSRPNSFWWLVRFSETRPFPLSRVSRRDRKTELEGFTASNLARVSTQHQKARRIQHQPATRNDDLTFESGGISRRFFWGWLGNGLTDWTLHSTLSRGE